MTLEERMDRLEIQIINLQNSLFQMSKNQTPITSKAEDGYNKIPQVDSNTQGVSENDTAICDIAELSDVNSEAIDDLAEMADTNSLAIDDLAEMIDDLEQRVEALEEKNNEE